MGQKQGALRPSSGSFVKDSFHSGVRPAWAPAGDSARLRSTRAPSARLLFLPAGASAAVHWRGATHSAVTRWLLLSHATPQKLQGAPGFRSHANVPLAITPGTLVQVLFQANRASAAAVGRGVRARPARRSVSGARRACGKYCALTVRRTLCQAEGQA